MTTNSQTHFGAEETIVYRDNDHLTSTFLRTLLPWFGQRLEQAVGTL